MEGKGLEKKENVSKFPYGKPKWQFIPYFSVQSGISVQLLLAS